MTSISTAQLGNLVEILSGFPFESDHFGDEGDLPIVRIRDVVPGKSSTYYTGDYDSKYILIDGDVLIGMDGDFNRARWRGGKALLNQRVCKISALPNKLDEGYLYHFLPAALKSIWDDTPFVTVKHLSVKDIRAIDIPLPPIVEQRRIADILDRADALRAKRRAALARLDELTQAIFVETFGDPISNPKGWPTKNFGALLIDGPQNGLYKHSSDYGSGTPILRIDAFYDGKVTDISLLKRVRVSEVEKQIYGLREADVVINRVNSIEYLGKCALIPRLAEQIVFESNMMRMKVDESVFVPRFAVQFLQTDFVRNQIACCAKRAVNQASINQKDVCGFTMIIPPVVIQQRFVAEVSAIEKMSELHHSSLEMKGALFASLQDRAFRGAL